MNERPPFTRGNSAFVQPLRRGLVLAFMLMVFAASGVTNNVSSIAALQTAINNAVSGDVIVLANGTYSNNTINLSKSGITVRAATPGGVTLNGVDAITISGSRTIFSGFQFINSGNNVTSGIPISVTGNQNLITQLNFDGYSMQKYINIQAPSQSNEVACCNFRNKPVTAQQGNLIHVDPDSATFKVGYHKIRYCSFQDMPGAGGDNGNECIRLSNGAESNIISSTIVEFCYFENTGAGDSEAISVKCRGNVLRYNTFTNNPDAMMVMRSGSDNVAYGNFFINAGGIRVKEVNNIFSYNNYFQNSGVGGTMPCINIDYVSPFCSNINFFHNTFVECGNIDLGGIGPLTNTWANNIFKKSSGAIFINPNGGSTWPGNIYQGTLGFSLPPGFTNVDPQLVINSDGYYGLSSNSPAIDASSTNYPTVLLITNVIYDQSLLLDVSLQARPSSRALKDAGCDEFTTGSISNRPLSLSDVGPSYLGGPLAPDISTQPQSQSVNVGAPVAFFVVATGSSPLTYQWRFNGTNLAGATAPTNIIAAVQATNAGNYTVVVANPVGSVTSIVATLTVNGPPSIGTQPQDQTVIVGSPASFIVVATGTAPLSYQWRKNGTNIVGATTATNSIASAQITNAGVYSVVVTNVAGSITSAPAILTVNVAPTITLDPQNLTVSAGAPASFWVVAAGTSPLSYQWRKNGTNIIGANTASNSLAAAQSADVGNYSVVVTNVAGSITSAVASLTVIIVPPQIASIVSAGGGTFTLSGTGPTGEPYRILATTNVVLPLLSWPVAGTGVFTGGVFTFTDTQTTNLSQRFYRVATP